MFDIHMYSIIENCPNKKKKKKKKKEKQKKPSTVGM